MQLTDKEILIQLEALGSEKMRLFNKKRGAPDNQFGLTMGDIRNVVKKVKPDNELAKSLWKTGNLEARLAAMLITAPKKLTLAEITEMAQGINYAQVADWFNSYVLKEFPDKEKLRELWMTDTNPWVARSGWSLTSGRIARSPEGIDISAMLDRIEKEMPTAPPEVQWTMNTSLAQIGINHAAYRERALAIGEKLGIYRDYPVSKGCTSPFAPIWINEMVSRQK
jgi:3-methyladenine DNA glycosylase AlkD